MSGGWPVMVVGGGPAGAAFALAAARAGQAVLVLERRTQPHDKVCGEFISGEAAAALARLGLDLAALGAQPIERLGLNLGPRRIERPLPFPALSLSRRRLDAALLDAARAQGASVVQAHVLGLEREGPGEGGGWRARLDDGGAPSARHAVLAVGKHDLKGHRRGRGLQDDLVGFKMHWRLAPRQALALAGAVELFLFEGGYAGLEPVEDGVANLCLLVRRSRLSALGGGWPALLAALTAEAPRLGERLAGAAPLWPKPLAVSAIPYGYVQARAQGLWRLGDQAAVIPSFAGDGLAIALHSAGQAATAWLAGEAPERFQRRLAHDLGLRVRAAALVSQVLTQPVGQRLSMAAAALWPGLAPGVAAATRVPQRALARDWA